MSGDSAPKKHRNLRTPWQLGQSGNPAGRKVGSRNKLAQDFIDKVYEDWQAHGAKAIIAMRGQSPSKYCSLVAALIPQHFKLEHDHTLMLNEDELRAKLLEIRTKLLDSDVDPELLGPPPDSNG
jgi:hypothetical protein